MKSSSSSTKKACIIGGGISGIITAATLQADGHSCTIYEQEENIGGIWRNDAYPGARLQNLSCHYHHPDLDWPEHLKPDLHATREQICAYMEYCVEAFQLNLKLDTKVVKIIQEAPDGGWTVFSKTSNNSKQEKEAFEYCIIAQGHFNKQISDVSHTAPPEWRGQGLEDFLSNGGTILSRHNIDEDFSCLENKRVAVVGFGKTAVDFCQAAVENGAVTTQHIFRKARWLVPQSIFGLHYTWLLYNRINNETIPCWDHASPSSRLLHRLAPGMVSFLWNGVIQNVVWFIHSRHAWFQNKTIAERFQLLKPTHQLLNDHRSASALCPPLYYQMVAADKVVPVKGDIKGFTKNGLELQDGTKLEVDVVLLCIGPKNSAVFPYLPANYRSILEKNPYGVQLYRHLVHPQVPRMFFAGHNHGFLHCVHAYLGSIWISCAMREEFTLPSSSEQLDCIRRIQNWKQSNIAFEPVANSSIATRLFHYNDIIMMDLGLSPRRKANPVLELLARYGAKDYKGVLEELQAKRKKAQESGSTGLVMRPIDRDM